MNNYNDIYLEKFNKYEKLEILQRFDFLNVAFKPRPE